MYMHYIHSITCMHVKINVHLAIITCSYVPIVLPKLLWYDSEDLQGNHQSNNIKILKIKNNVII